MKKIFIFTLLVCVVTLSLAQNKGKVFTLENIFKKGEFYPAYPAQISSMQDGDHYSMIINDSLNIYNYKDGAYVKTVITLTKLRNDTDNSQLSLDQYAFSRDETSILIASQQEPIYRHSRKAIYYIYDIQSNTLEALINDTKKVSLAAFSPDGKQVSYVWENNIYLKNLSSGEILQVSEDGLKNHIINGTCDWVYEEEFGFSKAYFWSPDGMQIAYYSFDESSVNEFNIPFYNDHIYPDLYTYKYPKPGEANSLVGIRVYDLKTGKTTSIDLGPETDIYIPRIKWTRNKQQLALQRLNRLQNKLEVLLAHTQNGTLDTVYTETNPYYIEITDAWTFLPDKQHFLITSETDGYNHIYLYDLNGNLVRQLTKGRWDVIDLVGYDPGKNLVYYISAETSPMNRDLYAVRLDGYKTRISAKEGTNRAHFSSNFKYYLHQWSTANTPPVYTVNKSNGKELRILEANDQLKLRLKDHGYINKTFFSFTTAEGISLNGWMIKPRDFDPQKKYPVLMYVYGGPNSQTVLNAWNNRNPWYELLAQNGIMVVSVDNRGTGARGQEFRKITYQQLGKYEIADQIAAAQYLSSLDYVDPDRIGIFGWSYGGFMSTLAMTVGADYFHAGIAVAPVTHYKYYDNIYTERFMRTPQENPRGYDNNSPIAHVDRLKGAYLLIHGSADDNVHYQNTMELIKALVEANKQFDLMIYPNKNHFIYGGNTTYHLYQKMTHFLFQHLKNQK